MDFSRRPATDRPGELMLRAGIPRRPARPGPAPAGTSLVAHVPSYACNQKQAIFFQKFASNAGAAPGPTLTIAGAGNDPQRGNKFVRRLIVSVISVVSGSVKRVRVSMWQEGSNDHA
jgi:hypothetical protein